VQKYVKNLIRKHQKSQVTIYIYNSASNHITMEEQNRHIISVGPHRTTRKPTKTHTIPPHAKWIKTNHIINHTDNPKYTNNTWKAPRAPPPMPTKLAKYELPKHRSTQKVHLFPLKSTDPHQKDQRLPNGTVPVPQELNTQCKLPIMRSHHPVPPPAY
jgi:hypothetical protein